MALTNADVHHHDVKHSEVVIEQNNAHLQQEGTYCTAGANVESGIVPNPAARTAFACKNPMAKRTPSGMASKVGLPMSNTKKKNQSVKLSENAHQSRWVVSVNAILRRRT